MPGHHHHTVLLVEDHGDTRDALQACLTAHHYAVICARDGKEALDLARRGPRPCVILLDLMMPGVSGFDFRAEQEADPALREIPVVITSGIDDVPARAVALHVRDYLTKPVELDRLMSVIDDHCNAAAR